MSGDDGLDEFVDDLLANGEQNPPAPPPGATSDEPRRIPAYLKVLVTTVGDVPGHVIKETRGIVTARYVLRRGGFGAMAASLVDKLGGRSGGTEAVFPRMEQECFGQLKHVASQKGCNAVIGVSLRFGELTGDANLFFATATGTAVIYE